MTKNIQRRSLMQRIGYGPLLVPPLAIIIVLSFGFMMVESHIETARINSAAANKERLDQAYSNSYHIIKPADLNTFPALDPLTTGSNSGAPSVTTPQPPSVTGNDLQSAKTNDKERSKKITVPSAVQSSVDDAVRTAKNSLSD